MTWITDGGGTRWVEIPTRKRRRSPRALRFADIKVGDQLMKVWRQTGWRGGKDDMKGPPVDLSRCVWYYAVTDLWFDPVRGQENRVAGEMVGIVRINQDGTYALRKEPHTKRGLASQGFHYADLDLCALAQRRQQSENVVGIGRGHVIRRRPKTPGGGL